MEAKIIHNVGIVYEFLKTKNKYDYIYQFYNLAEHQWNNVVCYGLFDEDEIKEIAMVIMSYDIPVLLAAGFDNERYSMKLIEEIKKFLPRKFYTHIDKITLEHVFSHNSILEMEEYMNMGFIDDCTLEVERQKKAERLGFKDIDSIKELISVSYPEAWLDDDLVKLNENFGIYVDEKLVSFAGIHAYSEQYQVAAVAHVTTSPKYRKRGYAEEVVSALSKSLREKIECIGLNVKVDNLQAINCYTKLGYREFGRFIACEIQNDR
jgi:ribosomal protein S18 acetylase RimI-like enzyme